MSLDDERVCDPCGALSFTRHEVGGRGMVNHQGAVMRAGESRHDIGMRRIAVVAPAYGEHGGIAKVRMYRRRGSRGGPVRAHHASETFRMLCERETLT